MTIERLLDARRALEAGDLDGAERVYRQVATADPRSSIAVAGLAQVADERGDAAAAIGLARQALAIDPANAAARRLLATHAEGSPLPDAHNAAAARENQSQGPSSEDLLARREPADASGSWLARLLRRARRRG
jgi:tetratricopeptide (TPR) repeat protein